MFKKFGIQKEVDQFEISQVLPLKYPQLSALCEIHLDEDRFILSSSGPKLIYLDINQGKCIESYEFSKDDNITQISSIEGLGDQN